MENDGRQSAGASASAVDPTRLRWRDDGASGSTPRSASTRRSLPSPPAKRSRGAPSTTLPLEPPELSDDIMAKILTLVARAADGGVPSILAAGAVCRSWQRAARSPDLWRDIARKRFGFSHDLGHGFGLLPGDETNRELCRRVITSPEAPFDYVRGRWWRAVANLRRYRVTLRHPSAPRDPSSGDDDEVDDPFYDAHLDQLRAGFTAALDEPDTVESARDALVEMSRLEMHRRNVDARRRARREDSLARRTPRFRFFSPPEDEDDVYPEDLDEVRRGAHRPHDEVRRGAHRPHDGGGDGGGSSVSFSRENGVATATATVDAFDPGAAVVTDHALALTFRVDPAMLTEIMAGGDRVRVTIEAETTRRPDSPTRTDSHRLAGGSTFARLCEFTATSGFAFRPSKTLEVPARILVDGAAFLSARAPATFTHEYFHPLGGFGRVRKTDVADFATREETFLRRATQTLSLSGFTIPPPLLATDVAPDAVAGTSNDAVARVAGAYVLAVSFTSHREMDALRASRENAASSATTSRGDGHQSPLTSSPATRVARVPVPRRNHGSDLVTFKLGDGAAASAMRALERVAPEEMAEARCHLSLIRRDGAVVVTAFALAPFRTGAHADAPSAHASATYGGATPAGALGSRAGNYGLVFATPPRTAGDENHEDGDFYGWNGDGWNADGHREEIRRAAAPRVVRARDAVVAVGHSMLVTLPLSALALD